MRLRIGSGFGIPIYLHWTFFLVPVWILMQPQDSSLGLELLSTVAGLLFVCVVLHEFGHVLAARYFGIGTHDVTLYPIGGVARLKRMSERPLEEFVIAVAGPAVNVVIAVVLACVMLPLLFIYKNSLANDFVGKLGFAVLGLNVLMVLFNLLPAFPMDGGRVFRAFLASFLSHHQATLIAVRVGMVMAILMAIGGAVSQQWMLVAVAAFVFLAGQQELAVARYREQQRQAYEEQEPPTVLPVWPVHRVQPLEPAAPHAVSMPGLIFQPKISVETWDNQTGVWRKDPNPPA
jgi:Zn-dependent protease